MKRQLACASLFFSAIALFGDETFADRETAPWATDYMFVDADHPWYFEVEGRAIGKADFTRKRFSHLNYRDVSASLFYSQFLSERNLLTYEIGGAYFNLDWDKNPRFRGENYPFGVGSVAFITNTERWRWIIKGALSVDATTFDFGRSGVYYGLVWGRYRWSDKTHLHAGVFGYTGIKNSYLLPILGFDWLITERWKLNAIFPFDASLEYKWAEHWSASLELSTFGGPYKSPKRAHDGIGRYKDAIFEVFSQGLDLNLNYIQNNYVTAGLGAGWNFGGWVLIKDADNHHGKYYDFKGAPYAQAYFTVSF